LGIGGETVWRVPPLSVPAAAPEAPKGDASDALRGAPTLGTTDAERLFVERARLRRPEFTPTPDEAVASAEICRRLDGMPLAIELAAARTTVLSVHQIAARLHDRFRLLTGGTRQALPRQQTLRAAMDWSYDLLTDPERAVLRRSRSSPATSPWRRRRPSAKGAGRLPTVDWEQRQRARLPNPRSPSPNTR
jgi:predicted ATPase